MNIEKAKQIMLQENVILDDIVDVVKYVITAIENINPNIDRLIKFHELKQRKPENE